MRCRSEKLTIITQFMRSKLVHSRLDFPEELSTVLRISRGPEFLEQADSVQSPRPRLFESVLPKPKHSLAPCSTTQIVRIIDRVRLGAFDVNVCVIESALAGKYVRKEEKDPKLLIVRVERRGDPK